MIKTINGFLATVDGTVKVEYFKLKYIDIYEKTDVFYRENSSLPWRKLYSWSGCISSREDVAKNDVQSLKNKDIAWCEKQIKEYSDKLYKLQCRPQKIRKRKALRTTDPRYQKPLQAVSPKGVAT